MTSAEQEMSEYVVNNTPVNEADCSNAGACRGGFPGVSGNPYGFHQVLENYLISRLQFMIQYKSSL